MLPERGYFDVDVKWVLLLLLDVQERPHKRIRPVGLRANIKAFELESLVGAIESLRLQAEELLLADIRIVRKLNGLGGVGCAKIRVFALGQWSEQQAVAIVMAGVVMLGAFVY